MGELESDLQDMGLSGAALRALLHKAQVVEVTLTDILVKAQEDEEEEDKVGAAEEEKKEGDKDGGAKATARIARELARRVTKVSKTAAELIREDG